MGGPENRPDPVEAAAAPSVGASRLASLSYRAARRIAVAIVGATLGLVGVVLIFTPGPAVVILMFALAVLSVEFAWARRWLQRLKKIASDTAERVVGDRKTTLARDHPDPTAPSPQAPADSEGGRSDAPGQH